MRVARLGRALRGVELEDTEGFVVRFPRGTSRDVFDERTRFDVLVRRLGRRLTSSIATLLSVSLCLSLSLSLKKKKKQPSLSRSTPATPYHPIACGDASDKGQ
jgi:hypothetical protein